MNIGYFMQSRMPPIGYLPAALRSFDEETSDEIVQSNCSQTILHDRDGAAGPYYYYSLTMNYFDETKNTDEAKALHFLTMCFKTGSAYADSCYGAIEAAIRKITQWNSASLVNRLLNGFIKNTQAPSG